MTNLKSKFSQYQITAASRIYFVSAIAVQLAVLALLAFGITTFSGKAVNVISAIDLIFSIFNIGFNYRGIFGTAISVMYFIILVIVFSNLIYSLKILKSFKKNGCEEAEHKRLITSSTKSLISTLVGILSLITASKWLYNIQVFFNGYLAIALCVIAIMASLVIILMIKKSDLHSIIINVGMFLIFVVAFAATYIHTNIAAVQEIIDLFLVMPHNPMMGLFGLLESCLYISLACQLLYLIYGATDYLFGHSVAFGNRARNILIVLIVIIASNFLHGILGKTLTVNVNLLLSFTEPFVPVLSGAVALFVASCFTYEPISNSTSEQGTETNGHPEGDIVKIDSTTVGINAEQYKDKRSITDVFIPLSVVFVGKAAFYGCSSLKNIYCAATEKPTGWDEEWKLGCYAEVHWGYIPPENKAAVLQEETTVSPQDAIEVTKCEDASNKEKHGITFDE